MKAAMLILAAIALSGCTTGELEYTKMTPDAEGKVYVDMTGALTFAPSHIEIPAGTTIVFESTGSVHNVKSDDGAWTTSPMIESGETWELMLDEPGDYPYHCTPHLSNGMKGVIRVV